MQGRIRGHAALAAIAGIGALTLVFGTGAAAGAPVRIAFRAQGPSLPDTATFNIFTARSDGSDLRRVTQGHYDLAPSWSPHHRRLVFGVLAPLIGYIEIVDADGSHRHILAHTDDSASPD